MENNIVVIVKVANHSFEDQRLECNPDFNVLHLKEKICEIHPAKPLVKDQKLIYSGHLLKDDIPLKIAFRHSTENNENTVHLVCSNKSSPPVTQEPKNVSYNVNTSSSGPTEYAAPSTTFTGGVRRRRSNEQPLALSQQGAVGGLESSVYSPQMTSIPPQFQGISDPVQQMAMMQQMYAQYMTSYMQYMMQSSNIGSSDSNVSSSSAHPISMGQNDNLSGQENERELNVAVEQRERQNRVNAQAFNEDDEEGMLRDWLDYVYLFARMSVLFSIVYFYSTFSRFLIVACASILLYMYQCGWFRFGANEERVEAPPSQPQQEDVQNDGTREIAPPTTEPAVPDHVAATGMNQVHVEEENSNTSIGSHDTLLRHRFTQHQDAVQSQLLDNTVHPEPSSPVAVPELSVPIQPPQPSILSLSVTFLTTFFTSLLPEQQQVI